MKELWHLVKKYRNILGTMGFVCNHKIWKIIGFDSTHDESTLRLIDINGLINEFVDELNKCYKRKIPK